jgi:RNA polymerase sigma-70 factor (ECF subfamily)
MIALSELVGERRLIERLKQQDATAYEELVQRHGPSMLRVIRRYLPQEHDSDDALQDALLSIFRAIGRFQSEAKLGTWLHRIAVNAALMRIRSRKRRNEQSVEELFGRAGQGRGEECDLAKIATATPARQLDEETREWVRKGIAQLSEPHRAVLQLRDLEERSTEEAAKLLSISKANVKTRLHRARQALKALLQQQEGGAAYLSGGEC